VILVISWCACPNHWKTIAEHIGLHSKFEKINDKPLDFAVSYFQTTQKGSNSGQIQTDVLGGSIGMTACLGRSDRWIDIRVDG
jgi:hypothetical protein